MKTISMSIKVMMFTFIITTVAIRLSAQPEFIQHVVTENFTKGADVIAVDLDQDGYMDIVATNSNTVAEVAWWKNDGNNNFTKIVVCDNLNSGRSVRAADINNDQEIDLVAAVYGENSIIYLENDGNEVFTSYAVDDNFVGAHTIDIKDMNDDGHPDILCSGFDYWYHNGEIAWWENDGEDSITWTKHLISDRFQQSPFVFAEDIDGDDDLDVLACGELNDEILWWENDGDENFTEHMVDSQINAIHTVIPRDVDLDGDMDILAAACMSSQIAWYENDGSQNFTKHYLGYFAGALWLDATDLDNDGDQDLFGAPQGAGKLAWWENPGDQQFIKHNFNSTFTQAFCVVPTMMDNDNDVDLVAIGWQSNKISWFENKLFTPGSVIHVPDDQPTIQAGIDAAINGDTVLVACGTYYENINFNGKNIVVASHYVVNRDLSHIINTIIDGNNPATSDTASCVLFCSGEDSTAVLCGFTLTLGTGTHWVDPQFPSYTWHSGGGIFMFQSSPTIKNNYIIDNHVDDNTGVSGASGGGICMYGGNPIVINNIIKNNTALYGAGVVIDYSGCVFKNNIVAQNTGGQNYGGGGFWMIGNGTEPVIIENNTIVDNVSESAGGAMYLWSTQLTARNNIFWNNTQASGDQIYLRDGASVEITWSDVEGGYNGEGNIDLQPQFADTNFLLQPNSPCIDAGNPDEIYNDPEDEQNPGQALWPSMGELRNDMGAYGGPLACELQDFTTGIINSFSHLGDFHTINYSGDYEYILDYLDSLYVGGRSQIFENFGCSIFSGIGDPENIFYGRNFDNPQQDVLVGKYSTPGCYESIALNRLADLGLPVGTNFDSLTPSQSLLLLRAPYFAADGFNSMGVATALAYVEVVDVQIDTAKQTIFITRWVREILDHAATVEEAVEITNSYNIVDNMYGTNTICHHLLVTDSSGSSSILEYHEGQFMVIDPEVDWQVLTNTPVYNVPLSEIFAQCYRYELLYNALESQNGIITDWNNGLDILELPTWGNLSNGTQWSDLFDLNENVMYLSLYRDFDNIAQVDVENFEFINYGDFTIDEQLEIDENGNNINEPGESVDIILYLSVDFISTGVEGTISSSNPGIVISSPTGYFGDINPGEMISNVYDPFEIEISEDAVPQEVVLNLSLTTDYDYVFETEIMITISTTTFIDDNTDNASDQMYVLQNYPNPFNSSTTISFQINKKQNEQIKLEIYNLMGQRVKDIPLSLCHSEPIEGREGNSYSIKWDGTDDTGKPVASGIYFYSLNFDHKSVVTKRMILLK